MSLAYQEELTSFEKRVRKDTAHGLPMNIMQTQCGGPDGFREAQARNDVYRGEENGRERWYWHESEDVREHGWEEKSNTRVGQKKTTHQEVNGYKCSRLITLAVTNIPLYGYYNSRRLAIPVITTISV